MQACDELLILIFSRLQDFPPSFIGIKINKGLDHLSGEFGVGFRNFRQAIELVAVSIENGAPSGQLVGYQFRNWHTHRGRILSSPHLHTQARQMPAKTFNSSAVAWTGQYSFVRTEAARPNAEVDQATLRPRKPDQASSSVGSARWVIRIYEAGISNVLGFSATPAICVADEWRPLLL